MAEGSRVTVADPPVPKPENTAVGYANQQQPPQPPPTQNPDPTPKPEIRAEEEQKPSETKKRKWGHVEVLRNSTYFKIRSIIKDLRPLFIEVIHAPDFRESKAANDIRKHFSIMALSANPTESRFELSLMPYIYVNQRQVLESIHSCMPLRGEISCQMHLSLGQEMKTMIELTRQLRSEAPVVKPNKSEEEPLAGANKEEKKHERENHVPLPQHGKLPTAAMEKLAEAKGVAKQIEEGFQGTYVIGGSPVGWNFLFYLGGTPVYCGETKASFRARQAAKQSAPI